MDRNDFKAKPAYLHSREADNGAWSLIHRLESGEMKMDVLPNGYAPFYNAMEEQDLLSYTAFLKSSKGQLILQSLDQWDEKEKKEIPMFFAGGQ